MTNPTPHELPEWTHQAAETSGVTIPQNQARTKFQRNTVQLIGTTAGAWAVKVAIADGIIHPNDIEFITDLIGPEGVTAASFLLGAILYASLIRIAAKLYPPAVPYLEGSKSFPVYMAKNGQ